MGEEGQPRYSTELTDEYLFKYRTKFPRNPGLFVGDDRDTLFKTVTGLQYGTIIGVTSAATMIFKEEPYLPNAHYKAFKYGLPCVLVGATYGATVGITAKVRGKSDAWNHIVAGLVSGQLVGGWSKSVPAGRWCSVLLAAVGGIVKGFADADALFTDPRPGGNPLNVYRASLFSTRPDREGIKDSS